MSQSSPVVMIDGVKLNSEHVERELLKVKKYCIPMNRIVLQEKELGHGGFGIVKRATLLPPDSRTGTSVNVVVKELKIDDFKVIPLRAAYRLVREMFIWAKCEHENVLQFVGYHLGNNYDPAYLISPYMKNGNISEYIENNRLGSQERLKLVQDTIRGVKYLHTQDPVIVHGDLKAANVLVNDSRRAQLCDFGLSKVVQESHTGMTTKEAFMGSLQWCSPEIIGKVQKTCASDIWAWGCLVLEIMTDKVPFPDIKDINQMFLATYMKKRTPEPDPVPNSLEGLLDLLRKCWEFESKERPDAYVCHCMLDAAISKAELSSSFRHWEISTMDSENKAVPSDMSNGDTGKDSIVAPGYRIYDNQVPPELPGTLEAFRKRLSSWDFVKVIQTNWVRPDGLSVTVAIKGVTHPGGYIPNNQLLTLIKRETAIWATTRHPNILPFIGYQIYSAGVLMLISPWCQNGDLSTYIKARPTLPTKERLRLLHGAACGLTFLHTLATPIVHGNIGPRNIIIQDNLEAGLCDVGMYNLDRVLGAPFEYLTKAPSATGFHTPESIMEDEPVTTAGDVYAFGGVILFTMSGKAPFEGKGSVAVMRAIFTGQRPSRTEHPRIPATDSLWSLIEDCCGFKPEGRPIMPTVLSTLEDEMGNP